MAKQDDYTRYTIRIPTDLYERVKAAAGDKSVNAQIIEVLEEKYPAPTDFDRDLAEQIVAELTRLVAVLRDPEQTLLDKIQANQRFDDLRAAFYRMKRPTLPEENPTED
ncbi:hypothetical protein ACHFJ0_05070 [Paracoccus sp. NGMCC 1.201697]|uniref:Arc family DNA-binding protein n=1 Tax=Paracoccus broussonetiae subsp. drimophilus TaxID=3373869 RepID=A0ABW7LHK2_9RHOB